MKYLKVFEIFTNSPEEGVSHYNKKEEVLRNKLVPVKVKVVLPMDEYEEKSISPRIKLIGDPNHLDETPYSYSLYLKYNNRDSDSEIIIDVYIDDTNKYYMSIYKPYRLYMDVNEIYKVIKIINNGSDYIGGFVIDNSVEKEIISCLSDKEKIDTNIRL